MRESKNREKTLGVLVLILSPDLLLPEGWSLRALVLDDCARPSDACVDELAAGLFVVGDVDNVTEEEDDNDVDMVADELEVVGTGTVLSGMSGSDRSTTAAEGNDAVLFVTMAVAVAGCAL